MKKTLVLVLSMAPAFAFGQTPSPAPSAPAASVSASPSPSAPAAAAGPPTASPSPAPSGSPDASPAASASPSPTPDPATIARTEAADFIRSCTRDFHLPLSRRLVFSLDGTRVYFLVPVAKALPEKSKLPPERKLVGFDFKLNGIKVEPVFGLRDTIYADLVTTLDITGNATSLAALVTNADDSYCATGDVEFVGGPNEQAKPVKRKGFFGLVPTTRIPVLHDPVRRMLVQLDTTSMQYRQLQKVPGGGYPVFTDPVNGRIVLWNAAQRMLTDQLAVNKQGRKNRKVKFRDGYQVLQQGYRFAAIKTDVATNSFTIHEMPDWTGVTQENEFTIKMPPGFSAAQSMVIPFFDRKIALVTARNDHTRRRWQKVFLWDYREGKILREFSTSGTSYFGEAGISPDSKTIVLVQMNGTTATAEKLRLFNLSKELDREIPIESP